MRGYDDCIPQVIVKENSEAELREGGGIFQMRWRAFREIRLHAPSVETGPTGLNSGNLSMKYALRAEVAGILDFGYFSNVVQPIRRPTLTEHQNKKFVKQGFFLAQFMRDVFLKIERDHSNCIQNTAITGHLRCKILLNKVSDNRKLLFKVVRTGFQSYVIDWMNSGAVLAAAGNMRELTAGMRPKNAVRYIYTVCVNQNMLQFYR